MKYLCPSCKMKWEDSSYPLEQISSPLCVFCSGSHTDEELLKWQLQHVKDMDLPHVLKLLPRMYHILEEKILQQGGCNGNDSRRGGTCSK